MIIRSILCVLSLAAISVGSQPRDAGVVLEESAPIVREGRLVEAIGIETLGTRKGIRVPCLAADASRRASLLVAYIRPVCALLAPRRAGASTPRNGTLIPFRALGGVFTRLIDVGESVPASHAEVFSTAADNQGQIKITVYRGVRALVRDNAHVATFEIYEIKPSKRGTPQIEVTFGISRQGDITAVAIDTGTHTPAKVRVLPRVLRPKATRRIPIAQPRA